MADITRYEIPSIADLRGAYCNDVRRIKQKNGVPRPNVAEGSETHTRGEATASMVYQLHAKNAALQDATMDDTAVDADLVRLCGLYGIVPSPGAGAQGPGLAECNGTVVYPKDLEAKTKDGLRYKIVVSTAATTGTELPLIGVDTGKRTNQLEGTVLTWTSPPAGSAPTVKIGPGGLVNGTDPDNNARLRKRLQDRKRHPAASGSWAHYVKWAEENSAVEKAFCYPACQGPSTVDVAITVPAEASRAYTRQATDALVNAVALAIVGQDPEHADVLTTTVLDTPVDVVLRVNVPLPVADGGQGGGWIDASGSRWPITAGATPVAVSAVPTSPTTIQVDTVVGGNSPIAGAHIAVWSKSAKRFQRTRVMSYQESGLTSELVLWDPIDTSIVNVGDFISPDAEKIDDYGATMAAQFADLGPGEKIAVSLGPSVRLPRSYRRPLATEAWPSSFTSVNVGQLSIRHPEVTHVDVLSPTMPALPAANDPPRILVLGGFALLPR